MRRLPLVLPLLACVACGGARSNPNADTVPSDPLGSDTRSDAGRALTSLSPAQGPLSGGAEVTLVGTGFNDTMFATFGGRNCNGLNILSTTQARCFVPAGDDVGLVDVEVVWLDGVSALLPAAFDYLTDSTGGGGGDSGGEGGGDDSPVADRPPAPPPQDVFMVRPATDATSRNGILLNVEAAVFWVGVTPLMEAGAGVSVEFGVGPMSSDPSATPESFDWTPGFYAFDGDGVTSGGVGTHDHYQANLSADPGTYRLAVRARLGGGSDWLYGDVSGGVDGFDAAELPAWTISPP